MRALDQCVAAARLFAHACSSHTCDTHTAASVQMGRGTQARLLTTPPPQTAAAASEVPTTAAADAAAPPPDYQVGSEASLPPVAAMHARPLSATATTLHNEISVIEEGSREDGSLDERLTEEMHRTMSFLEPTQSGYLARNAL